MEPPGQSYQCPQGKTQKASQMRKGCEEWIEVTQAEEGGEVLSRMKALQVHWGRCEQPRGAGSSRTMVGIILAGCRQAFYHGGLPLTLFSSIRELWDV